MKSTVNASTGAKSMKLFASLISLAGMTASFTGCSDTFKPLPDEEKYAYIHALRDKTGYASSGEVLEESYDTTGGVFGTSFWEAKIQGEDAYRKIKKNLEKSEETDSELKCYYSLPEDKIVQCSRDVASLELGELEPHTGIFRLTISDPTGGRGTGE